MHLDTPFFVPQDACIVGHPSIDAEHREFSELLRAMLEATDAGLVQALQAVVVHVESHFALEEQLMQRYEFPARECHAEEHGRVLDSVHEVSERAGAGEMDIVRELAQALLDWFPGHSDYMDASLANWVTKKTTGGAPIVLRRSAGHVPVAAHT